MLLADKAISGKLPKQRSFCNYVTNPARPFISPTRSRYCETHPLPSLPSPPVFSHLIIDLRGLCVFGPVWEGRGKKLQRRFAGWWPAANKAERRRKAGGEFPAAGHETASRSIDAYAVVEARCTHTHTTMHCLQPSKMEHDRNNSRHPRLSNVPSTVRAVYSAKWETSKRFRTRETQREREIYRRSDCESKGEGKSILASRHAKHRLANYSRSLARIAWPFHPREPS